MADLIVDVPMSVLMEHNPPFENNVWIYDSEPITIEEIQTALDKNQLEARPYNSIALSSPKENIREFHIQRIAYLVKHGWDDPIELDVGVPGLGRHNYWWIEEGNHRYIAAIFKKQQTIKAEISGCINFMKEVGLLPKNYIF